MSDQQRIEWFASASPGTERCVRDELIDLGFDSVRLNKGGIPFLGPLEAGWAACLDCRTPQRIMRVLSRFDAPSEQALYDGVMAVDWTPFLRPGLTLSVSSFVHSSTITHSGYAALKVKDAIVDQLRDRQGQRPDVDRTDPDVRVFLYLARNRATVYLDLSGDALFMRGYRLQKGEAPLKETLAAAVLRLVQWDREQPLVDPMCGSGTIAIEAALWAGNVAPGIFRDRFGFERWADFDASCAEELDRMRGERRQRAHGQHPRITASDIDPAVLELARENARAAGVRLRFREESVRELRADGAPRCLVTNAPYGERLEADNRLFQEMGSAFMRLSGWRVGVLVGNDLLQGVMPMRPRFTVALRNGKLDCRLLVYDIP